MRRALLALVVALGAAAATAETPGLEQARQMLGPPRGTALQGDALRAATEETAALLRCPVCQGLSVADSPTGLAQAMKTQVGELLAGGYDREQVMAYFEASYGEFVRLEPARRGVNWLVWIAPVAGLLLGAVVVARALRRPAAEAAPPAAHVAPVAMEPALEPYLRRVREAAYGWPDGRPPGGEASR